MIPFMLYIVIGLLSWSLVRIRVADVWTRAALILSIVFGWPLFLLVFASSALSFLLVILAYLAVLGIRRVVCSLSSR